MNTRALMDPGTVWLLYSVFRLTAHVRKFHLPSQCVQLELHSEIRAPSNALRLLNKEVIISGTLTFQCVLQYEFLTALSVIQ